MNWFKHDANATTDAKIKKLLIKYGAIGYAIYFHCLELIASNVSETNITFELEHDAEIIADDLRIRGDGTKSGTDIVEEIMRFMVNLDLFEESNGHIFCFKLLKRLDTSMTSNPKMRALISSAKENHDKVMTNPDSIMQDKIRIDEIRIDEIRKDKNSKSCDKSQEKTKKSEATELLSAWNNAYVSIYNIKPDSNIVDAAEKKSFWASVNKQLQNKLKSYDLGSLLKTLEYAKKDSWIIGTGFKITTVFSDTAIQNAIQGYTPPNKKDNHVDLSDKIGLEEWDG